MDIIEVVWPTHEPKVTSILMAYRGLGLRAKAIICLFFCMTHKHHILTREPLVHLKAEDEMSVLFQQQILAE